MNQIVLSLLMVFVLDVPQDHSLILREVVKKLVKVVELIAI